MGEGLKRVAKLCGGLTATGRDGVSVRYTASGERSSRPVDAIPIGRSWFDLIAESSRFAEKGLDSGTGPWLRLNNGQSVYPEV